MTTETAPPPEKFEPIEFVIDGETALKSESKELIIKSYGDYFKVAEQLRVNASKIIVTDASQAEMIAQAELGRKQAKKLRCDIENTRKTLKEEALRYGQSVDKTAKPIMELLRGIEDHCAEQVSFAERQEAARIEEMRIARAEALAPYVSNPSLYALEKMDDDEFDDLLSGSKAAHEKRASDAKKAEEERVAREKAEAAERARIAEENAKLKAEAEKREAELKAERDKAEAQLKAEREAAAAKLKEAEASARLEREKVEAAAAKERAEAAEKSRVEAKAREKAEAEAKALREAEAKRVADEKAAAEEKAKADALAAKKAAAAPDKAKLMEFAAQVRALEVPAVKSADSNAVRAEIATKVANFANWIETQAASL